MVAGTGTTRSHRCHPPPLGGGSVGTSPVPSPRHERPSSQKRKTARHLAASPASQDHTVATPDRAGLVRGGRSCHRNLEPYGRLGSHRFAAGTDAPGAASGSRPTFRSTSAAVYGSGSESAHHRERVRAALAGGGDLSGGTKEPRGGNPAAMDGASHGPDHAVFTRRIFHGDLTGRPPRPSGHFAAAAGRLVLQGAAPVGRCLSRG